MLVERLVASVVLFLALMLLPWWLFVILGVIAFILVHNYYEGLVWALLADLIYGLPLEQSWWPLPFFLTAVVLLLIIRPLRYRLWY